MSAVVDKRTAVAEVVYDGPPRTPAWFAVRRDGITATDAVAIVGASDYRTALHVWLDKRGEEPPQPLGHYAEAGIRAEPMIAQWWAEDHDVIVRKTGIWAHVDEPWMRCSPDRLVAVCPDSGEPGSCGLEVKNRNAYVAGRWAVDVPDDVLAQAGWTMAVTGWSHLHVAALIGGNTPRWHRVDRDPELEAYLVAEAARVWRAHLDGVPPQVDPSAALARLMEALYPDRQGGIEVDRDRALRMWLTYAEACALEAKARRLKDQVRAEAVVALDAAEELFVVGHPQPLATFRARSSTAITAERLVALRQAHPRIYARLVKGEFVTTSIRRELRWARKVGESLDD